MDKAIVFIILLLFVTSIITVIHVMITEHKAIIKLGKMADFVIGYIEIRKENDK